MSTILDGFGLREAIWWPYILTTGVHASFLTVFTCRLLPPQLPSAGDVKSFITSYRGARASLGQQHPSLSACHGLLRILGQSVVRSNIAGVAFICQPLDPSGIEECDILDVFVVYLSEMSVFMSISCVSCVL